MKAGLWIILVCVALGIQAKAADEAADNAELKQIYDADQKDREATPEAVDWDKVSPRDRARRLRVRELIEQDLLKTGKDYSRAALVYQHGSSSDDFILAHVLAMTAVGKGDLDARWLAAATFDRLLQKLDQPQVFGTQFSYKLENGKQPWTMDPYNRALVPENLRKANCTPDLKSQAEMLDAFSHSREPMLEPTCVEAAKQ